MSQGSLRFPVAVSNARRYASAPVWARRIALLVLLVSVVAIARSLPVGEAALRLKSWSQSLGWAAPPVYLGVFLALTVLSLPTWPMPFLAGALFGTVWGTGITVLSIALAASATFGLARLLRQTWIRDWLERSPRLRVVEESVKAGKWKVVAAIRLSHLLPFGLQNYALGLTSIPFWTFLIPTSLVTLPGTLLQAHVGELGLLSVGEWRERHAPNGFDWVLRLGGLALIAIAVGYLGFMIRSVIRTSVPQEVTDATQRRKSSWGWVDTILVIAAAVMAGLAIWRTSAPDERVRSVSQSRDSQEARKDPLADASLSNASTVVHPVVSCTSTYSGRWSDAAEES